MSINLKTLIGKLDDTCRQASERAANLCMARGNHEVDLEHLFLALIEQSNSDFVAIARHCKVSLEQLEKDLTRAISQLQDGNTRTPVFSPRLPTLFEHAWLIASLDSQTTRIRSGHLIMGLLTQTELAQMAQRASSQFARFRLEEIKHDFERVTRGSSEAAESVGFADAAPAATEADDSGDAGDGADNGLGKSPALDQYTSNLTQQACDGKLDPVLGRESEIRQTVDILMRRRQNNPILTGEAGVGKTAVVEGLAMKVAAGDVPPPLEGVELCTLDMGLLQAGASVKGEFENRLKNVIDEVKQSSVPVILFIDEAHTMIGAGGSQGQSDAANLLKPALARGELRTIAATTWSEYKQYFEKDAALARRFQVVKVDEPSPDMAASMLRGMVPLMEQHFNVRILDAAITEACRLSDRYISGRQLPDKGVSVLDTACARVALAQTATPALIDDARKRQARLADEIAALEREETAGASHGERLQQLRDEQDAVAGQLAADEQRWREESDLVERIREQRMQLEQVHAARADEVSTTAGEATAQVAAGDDTDAAAVAEPQVAQASDPSVRREQLQTLLQQLAALQGETPLVPIEVDGTVVAEIVAAWTGIPLGRMVTDEIRTVRQLQPALAERVIGQDHALDAIAQRVRTARANLEDPNKPKGVFLFVGPSGVGKTETALALADILYGGERKLVTINMSEYQEAHTVSGLKGSPAGYVGYGEGGVLTEAVRRNPYSVILLDEIEKAHSDVLEMFFQVFDKGYMEDAEGREIDFRNTLIILTSNVGSAQIMQACVAPPQDATATASEDETETGATPEAPTPPDPEALRETLLPALHQAFKPAFLGRMKTIPFYPIADDVLEQIVRQKLDRIAERVLANHRAVFSYDDELVLAVLTRCTEVDSGARNVDHILNGSLLPEIADSVLSRMAEGESIATIDATADEHGAFQYTVH